MKKRFTALILIALILSQIAAVAYTPAGLTWDGAAAALEEISERAGLELHNSDGSYNPQHLEEAVALWRLGLFLGADGTFRLDEPLNRMEGAIMITRLLGEEQNALRDRPGHIFMDVPDWASPYVGYAFQAGLIKGTGYMTFSAYDPMPAEQFLTLLLRALGYQDNTDFVWDRSADFALQIGLIGGVDHTIFTHSNLFLRDNVAKLSHDVLAFGKKGGGVLSDDITLPIPNSGTPPVATTHRPYAMPLPPMELTSAGISDGAIASEYGQYGSQLSEGVPTRSLPLKISNAPAGTVCYAVVMTDPDSIPLAGYEWVHWLAVNIKTGDIQENASVDMASAMVQGRNSFGSNGYGGPTPPDKVHTYTITVYALNAELSLSRGFTLAELDSAMNGHVLGSAVLNGTYSN